MDERLKLTIPAEEIEAGAWEQIQAALKLPYLKKLAIMPDVHSGYDLPIGGVALLDGHIWPGAVGYDIGCGMCHINTTLQMDCFASPREIYDRIIRMVPVGFANNERPGAARKFPNASGFACLADAVRERSAMQVGTLGGGNHFIEIGVNSKGEVGITIHSGSRRAGWLIADFYMQMTGGPVPLTSDLGQKYLADMEWAQEFALDNRAAMMRRCMEALGLNGWFDPAMINENHNHAVVTPEGVLHRKGATPAEKGQFGIIPANMRDGVWITKGLGNEEFLRSASHGAGRTMSRAKAKKVVDPTRLMTEMRDIVTPDLTDLVDEAPAAYKPINKVLDAQDGLLVEIIDHFKPIVVVKG